MKRSKLFKLIPVGAAVAALSLGMSGKAQADAYAYSYDNISNFQIVFTNAFPGTPVVTSQANASLNGFGPSTGGGGIADAPIAVGTGSSSPPNPGQTYNNVFRPIGAPGGPIGPYSYGDAQIIAQQTAAPCTQTTGAGCGHFANDAETHLLGNGFSAAGGNNASGTTVVIPFAVGPTGATMDISFAAEPYIEAFLASASLPGSLAHADISASVEIDSLDPATGLATGTVFKWVPNGTAGDIQGGTHSADPCTLQAVFDLSSPGHSTYNGSGGTNTCVPAVFGATTGAGGFFHADSTPGVLPGVAGCDATHPCYRLALSMTENVSAKSIPEPATLALLGIGLAGLGFGYRRKKA